MSKTFQFSKNLTINQEYKKLFLLLKIRHKTKIILKGQSKMDNPEKLATYGIQDTRRREYRRGNQKWTIQINMIR
jgi:hypothetical protein